MNDRIPRVLNLKGGNQRRWGWTKLKAERLTYLQLETSWNAKKEKRKGRQWVF